MRTHNLEIIPQTQSELRPICRQGMSPQSKNLYSSPYLKMKSIRPIVQLGEALVQEREVSFGASSWAEMNALSAGDGDTCSLELTGDCFLYIYKETIAGMPFNRWIPYDIFNEIDSIASNATGQCYYDKTEGETMATATARGFDVTGCTDVADGIAVENGDAFDFLSILGTSKGFIVYIECYGESGTALNLNRINLQDGQRITQVCFARSAPNQYGLAFGVSASGEGILAPADLYTPCIIRTDHNNDASVMIYGLPNGTSRVITEGTSTSLRGFYFNDASGTQKTTIKSIFVFNKK